MPALSTLPLWIAPACLLGGALVPHPKARPLWVAGALLPLVIAIAPIARGETVLDDFAGRLGRVGSMDALLGFHATFGGLSLGILAVLVLTLLRERPTARGLTAAGVVTMALAEGLPTFFVGMVVALTAWAVDRARSFERPPLWAFGTSALLAMAAWAVPFWATGGRFVPDGGFLSDFDAPFRATSPEGPVSRDPRATGSLTLLGPPGATVYLGVADELQLRRSTPIGTAPMLRKEVPAGLHKVAIEPGDGATIAGDGLEVALLDAVNVRPGAETVIEPVGPSLSFIELEREIARKEALSRSWQGVTVGTVAAVFLASAWALLAFALAVFAAQKSTGAALIWALLAVLAERGRALNSPGGPPIWLLIGLGAWGAFWAYRRRSFAPIWVTSLAFAMFENPNWVAPMGWVGAGAWVLLAVRRGERPASSGMSTAISVAVPLGLLSFACVGAFSKDAGSGLGVAIAALGLFGVGARLPAPKPVDARMVLPFLALSAIVVIVSVLRAPPVWGPKSSGFLWIATLVSFGAIGLLSARSPFAKMSALGDRPFEGPRGKWSRWLSYPATLGGRPRSHAKPQGAAR